MKQNPAYRLIVVFLRSKKGNQGIRAAPRKTKEMSKRIVFGLVLPFGMAALLYYFMIKPNVFNVLPYTLHEGYFRDIIRENTFIKLFDAIVALITGMLLRIIFLRLLVPAHI